MQTKTHAFVRSIKRERERESERGKVKRKEKKSNCRRLAFVEANAIISAEAMPHAALDRNVNKLT